MTDQSEHVFLQNIPHLLVCTWVFIIVIIIIYIFNRDLNYIHYYSA